MMLFISLSLSTFPHKNQLNHSYTLNTQRATKIIILSNENFTLHLISFKEICEEICSFCAERGRGGCHLFDRALPDSHGICSRQYTTYILSTGQNPRIPVFRAVFAIMLAQYHIRRRTRHHQEKRRRRDGDQRNSRIGASRMLHLLDSLIYYKNANTREWKVARAKSSARCDVTCRHQAAKGVAVS